MQIRTHCGWLSWMLLAECVHREGGSLDMGWLRSTINIDVHILKEVQYRTWNPWRGKRPKQL